MSDGASTPAADEGPRGAATTPPQGKVQVFSFDTQALEEVRVPTLREACDYVGRRRVTWINVDTVDDPEVLAGLEEDFGIHPLTVEDIRNTHQRPKVEQYPGYVYVVTQMIRADEDGELITEQVSLLLSEKFVITIQDRPGDVFDGVRLRIRSGRPRMRRSGPDYLAYTLIDAIVDAYFPLIERIGLRGEELEDFILETPSVDIRAQVQHMRRQLLTLRRVAWPQRDALIQLERGETAYISAETRTFLRDVSDHATRVIDFVETNRELSASLMDLHLATMAERTNSVMKVLTVVATIFIPLTFVAGVYGMNFERMPELEHPYGYPTVLALMGLIGGSMLVAFRRRGWI